MIRQESARESIIMNYLELNCEVDEKKIVFLRFGLSKMKRLLKNLRDLFICEVVIDVDK